jgi:hypothetical protein
MRLRPLEDSGICARAIYQRSSISTPQVLQGADGIALMQSRPSCPQEGSNGSHKDRHLECTMRQERKEGRWEMDDAVVPLSLSSPDIFLGVDFEPGLLGDRKAAPFSISRMNLSN